PRRQAPERHDRRDAARGADQAARRRHGDLGRPGADRDDREAGHGAARPGRGEIDACAVPGLSGRNGPHYHRAMSIQINAAFDGGNIRLVGIEGDTVHLEIVTDHQSDFYQWFYFRVAGTKGRRLRYRILNAGRSAYPLGWPGYQARVSTDRVNWRMA